MSAKKSFDIGRNPKAKKPHPVAKPKRRDRRLNDNRKPLKVRRQETRARLGVVAITILIIVLGASLYFLWRPEVRIAEVQVIGIPDAHATSALVMQELQGTYYAVLPRNSIFLYPEERIRTLILDAAPSIAAVSITRSSFQTLNLEGTPRVTAFHWCGVSGADVTLSGSNCFEADVEGFVFAPVVSIGEEASSSSPMLRMYAEVDLASSTGSYPLRAKVIGASYLPNLLRFVKSVKSLGIPVVGTFVQGDEAELYVTPETRIKYVLGREEEAATSAQAAFPSLQFLDGSIEYADLRFDGKVYLKRRE